MSLTLKLKNSVKLVVAALSIYYLIAFFALKFFLSNLIFKEIEEQSTFNDSHHTFLYENTTVIDRVFGDEKNRECIVFFPGQKGGVFDYQYDLFKDFMSIGYTVHALSYPGYEGAKGKSTLESIQETINYAVSEIYTNTGCQPGSTVFIGRSLGATLALTAAGESMPKGIVVDSLSYSLSAAIRNKFNSNIFLFPLSIMPIENIIHDFNSENIIAKLGQLDIVVLQGLNDNLTPFKEIEFLGEKYKNVKIVPIPFGMHNDTHIKGKDFYMKILKDMKD